MWRFRVELWFVLSAAVVTACGGDMEEVQTTQAEVQSACSKPDDPSYDPHHAGSITYGAWTYEDTCWNGGVVEYMCSGLRLTRQHILCPDGCNGAGACILDVSITDYGAVGNGVTDDGAAFQAALYDAAYADTGRVHIPAGSFFVDRMLIVGDTTEIYGTGSASRVIRGNTATSGLLLDNSDCDANINLGYSGRSLFWNQRYNCGNTGIQLRRFLMDGSQITTVPSGPVIAFSAIADTHIDEVTIVDAPQDAIFLKNGGQHVSVTNTLVDGFNLLWGNGAGINIEMHSNSELPTLPGDPVRLLGNRIVVRSPQFCVGAGGDHAQICTADAECANQNCGSEIAAINANKPSGSFPPLADVAHNRLYISNEHHGIDCFDCLDSTIRDNQLVAYETGGPKSGLFLGITMRNSTGVAIVEDNLIYGHGSPLDGLGILMDAGSATAYVLRNQIRHKKIHPWFAQIEVQEMDGFVVANNRIDDGGIGHGIAIGTCATGSAVTSNGLLANNIVEMTELLPGYRPLVLRHQVNTDWQDNGNLFIPDLPPLVIGCSP